MAGRQALLYGLALLPISLLPTVQGEAGWLYAAGALLCGLLYVGCAAGFALAETRPRARALVLVSLAYLPALMTIALLDPLVHLTSSL
jgi:protoheme IX farnesyltransferase